MARIVQAANFYGPTSGGLRTTVDALGCGYHAAGHDRVLVVPGPADADRQNEIGRQITIRGRRLPGSGGHHFMFRSSAPVESVLREVHPDRLEVSDKLTLHRLGRWARARGIPAVLLSHERIDAILAPRVPPGFPLRRVADRRNRRLAHDFDTIVCASAFAAEEYERIGAANVRRVPLGVDLDCFRPGRHPGPGARLVYVGRLSREKRPLLAIDTIHHLVAANVDARLVVIGDGPQRRALTDRARGLPVEFMGALSHDELARKVAGADVALAPCPYETFGLAALEALASGTPVVCASRGAVPELIAGAGLAGRAAPSDPAAFADAVVELLSSPVRERRTAARRRAEQFPWARTVTAMLDVHDVGAVPTAVAA